MSEHEFVTLLSERMKEIAREAVLEFAPNYTVRPRLTEDASEKLREQLALIKAKEHITVKEAALLLSCSESHIRKLVRTSRKGKSLRPVPYIDMEGVTVFPLSALLNWASPTQAAQPVQNKHAIRNKAA